MICLCLHDHWEVDGIRRKLICVRTDEHLQEYGSDSEGHIWEEDPQQYDVRWIALKKVWEFSAG